jgi:hypothetical protein
MGPSSLCQYLCHSFYVKKILKISSISAVADAYPMRFMRECCCCPIYAINRACCFAAETIYIGANIYSNKPAITKTNTNPIGLIGQCRLSPI